MYPFLSKLIICSVFCVFSMQLPAQEEVLDSFIKQARNYKSPCLTPCLADSAKVNILDEISWELTSFNLDSALLVAEEALALAKKISWQKGIGRGHTQKAICLRYLGKYDEGIRELNSSVAVWDEIIKSGVTVNNAELGKIKALFQFVSINSSQGNYSSAIAYAETSLRLCDEIGNKTMKMGQTGNLGQIYQLLGDYPKALECYFVSLKASEELGEKRSIGINYNNLSGIYLYQEEYDKALEYANKALKIANELEDVQMQGGLLESIGLIYENKKDIDKAFEYAQKAIKIAQAVKDVALEQRACVRLCVLYTQQEKFEQSIEFGKRAIQLSTELQNDAVISTSRQALGYCWLKMKNYKDAEKELLESFRLAQKADDANGMREVEELLSQLYKETGKYEQAFEHYRNFIVLRDSLKSEENSRKLIKSQVNFEFEKKEAVIKEQQEKERAISEEEKRIQRIVIIGVVIVLVIVLFFTYMVVRSLRTTRKQKTIIEEKEKETQQQNLIITEQKHIVEEKHKEITDSINYAERIQRSLLASEGLLNDSLKDYFVLFQPKDVVSGDFYWAEKLSNNNFVLVTADSTGHGVPGAIMSILNISCLKESVKEGFVNPSDILNNTRKLVIDILKKDGSAEGGKDGMDCSLLSFDFINYRLTYAAANNPVWIVRGTELLEMAPDKMPVGKHDKDTIPFTQHTLELQKGDVVYTITDGFPDQFGGEKGKKFMHKRLKERLLSVSTLPMTGQKVQLQTMFTDWKGTNEQVDDVTLIGVRM